MGKTREEIENWLDNIITTKKVFFQLSELGDYRVCDMAGTGPKEIQLSGGNDGKFFLDIVKKLDLTMKIEPLNKSSEGDFSSKLIANYKDVVLFAIV